MVAEVEKLKEQLATLDGKDRATIARFLLETLDDQDFEETLAEVVEFDPDFQAELERREKAYRSGTSKASPASEVFARLRAKYS